MTPLRWRVYRRAPTSAAVSDAIHMGKNSDPVVLQVSTTPRETWLWAPTAADAVRARAVLHAARCTVLAPTEDEAEMWILSATTAAEAFDADRIIDVEIGVTAFESMDTLVAAGYILQWHPRQQLRNRWALPGTVD